MITANLADLVFAGISFPTSDRGGGRRGGVTSEMIESNCIPRGRPRADSVDRLVGDCGSAGKRERGRGRGLTVERDIYH